MKTGIKKLNKVAKWRLWIPKKKWNKDRRRSWLSLKKTTFLY